MDAASIAEALGGKRYGKSWKACCPSHPDTNPSLSLTDKDGKTLFKCWAGCTQDEVLGALRDRGLWQPENQSIVATRKHDADYRHAKMVEAIKEADRESGRNATWTEADQKTAIEADATITGLYVKRILDVRSKPIRWLWPGRFARGKVSMIAGHPGLGKSQITVNIAATVTQGGRWPVDNTHCEPGNVLFVSAEDDVADTIRPRLEASGADLSRCDFLEATKCEEGEKRGFDLGEDIGRLDRYLEHRGDVALIVIDPITAYLGSVDSHKNAEVRGLLMRLSELAEKHSVAVIAISHFNKGKDRNAVLKTTGSVAFVAAVRSVYAVAEDPDNPERRLFLPVKNNIGPDNSGLSFTIEQVDLSGGINTSRIVWGNEPVSISADDALSPDTGDERSALDEAKDFLSAELGFGPCEANQLFAEARKAGIAERTLKRAKASLKVQSRKSGINGSWRWELPEEGQGCQSETVAPLASFDEIGPVEVII